MNEKIKSIAERFGFEVKEGEVDLRNKSNEEVFSFFDILRETGEALFHGTNSEERFDTLEVRQGNDAAKESGNKKAVYADQGTTIPLAVATLNKTYIQNKFESYTTGWENDESGKMIYRFSPNVYELFKSNDPNLFSDGFVYILNKDNFLNLPDAGGEWYSEVDQKPILSCRVSGSLARDIFKEDVVKEFSQEEMTEIEEFNKK